MRLDEFLNKINFTGKAIIIYTNKFVVSQYPLNEEVKEEKLLDIRVFNDECEHRLFRTNLNEEFDYRYIDDTNEYFVDYQRLDIDTTKGKDSEGKVSSQAGGKYYLPIDLANNNNEDLKLIIHSYIDYDENGMAYIKDFRLKDFCKGEKYGKL